MPRIARKNLDTSFFHIIVQGTRKEYIFNTEQHKEKYLYLLKKYGSENNIEILAYCIMGNHAHILVYAENTSQMSKFMHKANGIYAQHYNKTEEREGILFRNRYVSEPIYNEKYLLTCINYIHLNPVKAKIVKEESEYDYSSYLEYINNTGVSKSKILRETLGEINYKDVFPVLDEDMFFYDIDKNKDERIIKEIKNFEIKNKKLVKDILNDNKELSCLVKTIKKIEGIKYADIGKVLGISRAKLDYLKKAAFKTRP